MGDVLKEDSSYFERPISERPQVFPVELLDELEERMGLALAGQHDAEDAPVATFTVRSLIRLARSLSKEQSAGAALIAQERAAQVSREGWTPEHDDEHDAGVMASAAACYAINAASVLHPYDGLGIQLDDDGAPQVPWWPWHVSWWKPKDPIRDLTRAGALIAAELDRLLRKKGAP